MGSYQGMSRASNSIQHMYENNAQKAELDGYVDFFFLPTSYYFEGKYWQKKELFTNIHIWASFSFNNQVMFMIGITSIDESFALELENNSAHHHDP